MRAQRIQINTNVWRTVDTAMQILIVLIGCRIPDMLVFFYRHWLVRLLGKIELSGVMQLKSG